MRDALIILTAINLKRSEKTWVIKRNLGKMLSTPWLTVCEIHFGFQLLIHFKMNVLSIELLYLNYSWTLLSLALDYFEHFILNLLKAVLFQHLLIHPFRASITMGKK